MQKKILFGSIAVLSLFTAWLVIFPPAGAKAGENKAQATEVKVDNFTFSPNTLTVPLNSSVTWINRDDIPHVIASNDGLFKSRALDTDQKFSYTFTKAGTYPYYCSVHPTMVGKIVVK
ncbi:MAG: cupredoxin family copper-binding protein [Chlamydiota bacterium]